VAIPAADRKGAGKVVAVMNKTLLTVLIVLGSIGFLGCLLCGGCGLWAFKTLSTDLPPAQEAADAFLDDLRSDRMKAAYARTSTGFQSAQTFERFGKYVDQFSTLKIHASRTFDGGRVFQGTGGKQVTIKMTLHSANKAMPCVLTLVPENGEWKVQYLNIQP
jgi:hypothetical protein